MAVDSTYIAEKVNQLQGNDDDTQSQKFFGRGEEIEIGAGSARNSHVSKNSDYDITKVNSGMASPSPGTGPFERYNKYSNHNSLA